MKFLLKICTSGDRTSGEPPVLFGMYSDESGGFLSDNSPENESSSASSVLPPHDPTEYSFAVTDPNWVPF